MVQDAYGRNSIQRMGKKRVIQSNGAIVDQILSQHAQQTHIPPDISKTEREQTGQLKSNLSSKLCTYCIPYLSPRCYGFVKITSLEWLTLPQQGRCRSNREPFSNTS